MCRSAGETAPPSTSKSHYPPPPTKQYCRSGGLPELVQALARHYSPLYGRELDANTEITVSVGVSEVCNFESGSEQKAGGGVTCFV